MGNMDEKMARAAKWLADANGVTLDQAKMDLAQHGGYADWEALVAAAAMAGHEGAWRPPMPKPLVQPRMTETEADALDAFRREPTMTTIGAWMEAFAAMMKRAHAERDELDRVWLGASGEERQAIIARMAKEMADTSDRLLAGPRGSGRIELPLPDLKDLLGAMPNDIPVERMN